MKTFRKLVRDLLGSRGMRQIDLARRLDVSHTVVTMVIHGQMKLPPARLEALFDALGVPARDRPLLRLCYLADIAPEPVAREAAGMCAALHSVQERGRLADALLAAEEAFGELRVEVASGAKRAFLKQVLVLLPAAGLADGRSVRNLEARLSRAKIGEDYTRIAARMAVAILGSVRETRKEKALEDLRRLLDKGMVRRLVEVARQAAAGRRRSRRS